MMWRLLWRFAKISVGNPWNTGYIFPTYVAGGIPTPANPSERYEFVNDDIPNMWKNNTYSKPPTKCISLMFELMQVRHKPAGYLLWLHSDTGKNRTLPCAWWVHVSLIDNKTCWCNSLTDVKYTIHTSSRKTSKQVSFIHFSYCTAKSWDRNPSSWCSWSSHGHSAKIPSIGSKDRWWPMATMNCCKPVWT